MRAKGEFHRRINEFLIRESAEDISFEPTGGNHIKIAFRFRGVSVTHTVAATPSDHRALANEIADIRRKLREIGPPIGLAAPARQTLEGMTMAVIDKVAARRPSQTAELAVRTIETLRELATPARSAANNAADDMMLLEILPAMDVSIHRDGADCDLIFSDRCKTVSRDRRVIPFLRPVAAVTLPLTTLLELYDGLEPIVKAARPEPTVVELPPEQPPAKPKRQRSANIPHGLDAILQLAEKLLTNRLRIAEAAGGERGAGYNRMVKEFYGDNPDLGELSPTVRSYLGQLGREADAVRQWGKTHLSPGLRAEITPSGLFDRWQERIEREAKLREPEQKKTPALRKSRAANGADHTLVPA